MDELRKNAILEYRSSLKMEESGNEAILKLGFLQCFCDARAEQGDDPKASYGLHGEQYTICDEYLGS